MPCRIRLPGYGEGEGKGVAEIAKRRWIARAEAGKDRVPTAGWQRHGGAFQDRFDLHLCQVRVLLQHERSDAGNVRGRLARSDEEVVVDLPVLRPSYWDQEARRGNIELLAGQFAA